MKLLVMLFSSSHRGYIKHVLINNLSGLDIKDGMSFLKLFDEANRDKAQRFFLELNPQASTNETELVLSCSSGKPMVLSFRGISTSEERWILAETDLDEMLGACGEQMSLNNQAVNAIRALYKERTLLAAGDGDISYLEELTKMNNELISMQRELSKKNVELAGLNELKNRFVGMAAHDLRNPLSAISSFSDFLLEDSPEGSPNREFIQIIKETSSFMLKMVEDMLDLTRMESGRITLDLVETDFCKLFNDSLRLHQNLADRRGILIASEGCPEPCIVRLDPVKMQQVISNLIGNAIKYSPPNTTIRTKAYIEEGELVMSVLDEGYGIAVEEQEFIFEPFRRAASSAKTTEQSAGLGLAITKNIVLAHKGKIRVDSEPGKGSTFSFCIPL